MASVSTEQAIHIALSHHQAGRLVEAEGVYRHVLSQEPKHATALNMFGVLAVQSGRPHLAIDLIGRAIEINPAVANYHCNLGESLRHAGRLDDAISAYREALRLKPDLAVAHNNLGIALAARKEYIDAIATFRRAVHLAPGYAEAHNNLGNALRDAGRWDEAITACRTAVLLKPGYAEGHCSLGVALATRGKIDDAIDAYGTAVALNPGHADAYSNLGNALAAAGRLEEARSACETAVTLKPDSVQAHWNLAVVLLRAGDFARGWAEYEWRWEVESQKERRRFETPHWDGSPLAGKTILLRAEQGFGDTIQFVRYVPLVVACGGRVTLECQPELARLMQTCDGIEQVIARGEPLPPFDEHAPLMSLPMIMNTRLETIPANVPYLRADPHLVDKWASVIGARSARGDVGIAWAGSRMHSNDRMRSIPVNDLGALSANGVRFHSVQNRESSAWHSGRRTSIEVIDHAERLSDFAQTAALLAHLDLLITVDTAVAHLAGAMGKETWLMLPHLADWRWLTGRIDSPWYPTMRLYRQDSAEDWTGVIRRVTADLSQRVSSFHPNGVSASTGARSAQHTRRSCGVISVVISG